MNFDSIMKLEKKELIKMRKEDIVEAIHTYTFYYKQNIERVEEAKEKLVEQSKGEVSAKKIMAGYLGKAKKDGEYESDYLARIDLNELLGEVLVKASRY